MGYAAELTEPTTGTEKHHPVQVEEEEDEHIVELERKTFRHGKGLDASPDSSTLTTNTSSSSSSFSGDATAETPEFRRNSDGDQTVLEILEQETEIGFHEEHSKGNKCNVFFDEEHGSESTDAEPDAHEDNKRSREIKEAQDDDDVSEDLDVVIQPAGNVIEEEVDIEGVEDYDVENVLDKQKTHDLYCPNCDCCITKRVVLIRRKRKIRPEERAEPKRPCLPDPILRSEDNLPSLDHGGENSAHESFFVKCLSCFTIFCATEVSSKPIPPHEGTQGFKTQPSPQEKATGDSKWFSSIFSFNQKGSAVRQVTNSHDAVNEGATVEDWRKVMAPSAEDQTQQKINYNDDSSPADGNHTPDKGRLSPINPSHGMSISNTVTNGPDGFTVKLSFHEERTPHLFDTTKLDFGPTEEPIVMHTGNSGVSNVPANPGVGSSPENVLYDGPLEEPLMTPVVVVEGHKLEILKSIVYGGLLEAITSLGVITSAAGSGASMLNILVLGLANLFGGLILIIHKLQELREEEPIRTTTEDNQTNGREEGRYKRLLGRRENFAIHASVAILSFIIVGILPPVVYYFSFTEKHNKDYKVVSVFGASLFCIVLLAIAKAHVNSPRGSYLKSILYYATNAVSVSGISYVVGRCLETLLEKYGWSDGSETHVGQIMLSSLMGRKAGGFGYSSSY